MSKSVQIALKVVQNAMILIHVQHAFQIMI